jgi:hypothetical protein
MSWAAAIGGIAQLAGGAYQNMASRREAKRNRKFQERMARHAYRYAMEDMEKAGLNPMLAFSQGGAATPSGSMATMANPMDNVVNSAKSAMTAKQSLKNMEMQEDLMSTQAHKASAEERYWRNKGDVESVNAYEAEIRENVLKSKYGQRAKEAAVYGEFADQTTKGLNNVNPFKWIKGLKPANSAPKGR